MAILNFRKQIMTKHNRAVISLIFVMLVWGSSFSVTKVAVSEMPAVYFAFLRFSLASLILILASIARRKKTTAKIPMGIVTLMGLTGVSFFYIFFNWSLKYTSASMGALLEGFIPIVIAITAAIFLKERLRTQQVLGILISVSGVILVGFVNVPSKYAPHPFLGNMLMIVCVFLWATYTILSKKVATYDPLLVITYTTVTGTLFLIPVLLVELHNRSWPIPTFSGWVSIIYLGAIGSALCYYLYNKALEQLSAAEVGNFLNLDPVTGAALAIIFLHEKIMLWQIVGCLLILTGVWLSTKFTTTLT
jgi:drug/metabolite transporter (DMT)-like permease